MRTDFLTFVVAAIMTVSTSAVAVQPVNPCLPSSSEVYISLGPIINANLKCWMSPGIISGGLIFFFVFAPLFFIVMMMTCAIQTPCIMPDKGINWGKIEEAE